MAMNELHLQFLIEEDMSEKQANSIHVAGDFATANIRFTPPNVSVRQKKYPIPPELRGRIDELFEAVDALIKEKLAE